MPDQCRRGRALVIAAGIKVRVLAENGALLRELTLTFG